MLSRFGAASLLSASKTVRVALLAQSGLISGEVASTARRWFGSAGPLARARALLLLYRDRVSNTGQVVMVGLHVCLRVFAAWLAIACLASCPLVCHGTTSACPICWYSRWLSMVRKFACINLLSMESLLGNETWTNHEPLWKYVSSDEWIQKHKGQFVELKAFGAMSPKGNIRDQWILRLDVDSVFVRRVNFGDLVQRMSRQPITLVYHTPNGSCGGYPVDASINNAWLRTSDPRAFGYGLASFWLWNTALYKSFHSHALKLFDNSIRNIISWIEAPEKPGSPHGPPGRNLLMTDAYYRYILNVHPQAAVQYRSIEDDELLQSQPLLRGKCGFKLHGLSEAANLPPHAVAEQISSVYAGLHGDLPTWVAQRGCRTAKLTEMNLQIINQTKEIFLVTIASGCQEIIRQHFSGGATVAKHGTAHSEATRTNLPPSMELKTSNTNDFPRTSARAPTRVSHCRGQTASILIPLHPKDAYKLAILIASAQEYVEDIENISIHIVLTREDEIEPVRQKLRSVSQSIVS